MNLKGWLNSLMPLSSSIFHLLNQRDPKEGQVNRAKEYLIDGDVSSCLMCEEEEGKIGLIDKGTPKNKVEGMKSETSFDQSDQGWLS
jgi:hypothetical protein